MKTLTTVECTACRMLYRIADIEEGCEFCKSKTSLVVIPEAEATARFKQALSKGMKGFGK